jgi:hypothetical protein
MKRKEGFLLIESIFELFIVSITMLIVLSTFTGTFFLLKDTLEEMIELNLLSNTIMEIIIVSKNEMKNVTSFTSGRFSSTILGDSIEGDKVGFSFDSLTQKLLRYRFTSITTGYTLISQKITAFSYDGKFIIVTLNEDYFLKLFVKDLR